MIIGVGNDDVLIDTQAEAVGRIKLAFGRS